MIRNRNEAEHLRFVFEALRRQKFRAFEIILVDNDSVDDSCEIARAANAKIVSIQKFSYGRALNQGIAAASGEIIVVLSAHSVPLGHYFLTECARAFEDERVGAARLVYAGKNADMTRWLDAETLESPEHDFISKGPLASGCAIRRRAWEAVPFDEAAIAAEEKIWAAAILERGFSIVSPVPAFYYYRKNLSPLSELRKNYRELIAIHQNFGVRAGFVKMRGSQAALGLAKGLLAAIGAGAKKAQYQIVQAYLQWRFPRA